MRVVVNVGIIGLGQIAWSIDDDPQRKGIWSHAGAYHRSPDTRIVAVSSRTEHVCRAVQQKYAIPNYYIDYRAMLAAEPLDIVSICTPIATHHDLVMDCVDAGVKAIFCEKTLSFDVTAAQDMVEACGERGVVLAVNYPRRWDSATQQVRALLDDDMIGTLRSIVAYGATALHTSTSHLIDLMCLYAGDPVWVVGETATDCLRTVHGVEDPGGLGMVRFASGVVGFIKGSSLSPGHYMSELDLLGTQGRIRLIDDGTKCLVSRFAESPESPGRGIQKLVDVDIDQPAASERLLTAVAEIVHCMKTGEEPASSGRSSLLTLKIVDGMHRSASNNNSRIVL